MKRRRRFDERKTIISQEIDAIGNSSRKILVCRGNFLLQRYARELLYEISRISMKSLSSSAMVDRGEEREGPVRTVIHNQPDE